MLTNFIDIVLTHSMMIYFNPKKISDSVRVFNRFDTQFVDIFIINVDVMLTFKDEINVVNFVILANFRDQNSALIFG